MTDERPNYATFRIDEASGLRYIVEVGTLKRLYKMPPCEICGIAHYSYANVLKTECGSCRPDRRERNDNEEAA